MTLGDIAKTIPLTHEIFRESPEHFKTPTKIPIRIQINRTYKFQNSRPLHHPPLKTSLVPETKTEHQIPKDVEKRGGQGHTQQPTPSTSKNTHTHIK